MKSTEQFKQAIANELQRRADADPLFAKAMEDPNKNINDCITYILNTVQKSGINGFSDDEVYGMAAHYYDEAEIEVGKPVGYQVIVNHKIELTPEEIEQAKDKAREAILHEERNRMRERQKPKTDVKDKPEQASLF